MVWEVRLPVLGKQTAVVLVQRHRRRMKML
jgi:hypothetical protein